MLMIKNPEYMSMATKTAAKPHIFYYDYAPITWVPQKYIKFYLTSLSEILSLIQAIKYLKFYLTSLSEMLFLIQAIGYLKNIKNSTLPFYLKFCL